MLLICVVLSNNSHQKSSGNYSFAVIFLIVILLGFLIAWVISQFQGGNSNQNPNGENETKNEQQNHVFGALVGKDHNNDLSVSGAIDPFVEDKVCLEGNGSCQ